MDPNKVYLGKAGVHASCVRAEKATMFFMTVCQFHFLNHNTYGEKVTYFKTLIVMNGLYRIELV